MKSPYVILLLTMIMVSVPAVEFKEKTLDALSTHPTWLKLLHYERGSNQSSVRDTKFFLALEGKTNPKKELQQTLKSYAEPFDSNNPNEHAQCRFPARYFWLSKHLDLPEYKVINPKCTDLMKWKLLKQTESISVVFVSGYLGNPASAFGHSFIKLNQSTNHANNLFDTTISYGALLPPEYTMPEYIAYGLFGGYSAAYSDKYFYHDDMVYSNQEVRDMWEYRLKLTSDQKALFLFHAWELIGKKFQYFFLNRNCGYKVTEFLELLYDEPLMTSAKVWYAPIETFYRLKALDEKSKGEVIEKIIYLPSTQQSLYSQYKGLSKLEKEVVGRMIEEKSKALPKKYQTLSLEEQSHVFGFLLHYYDHHLKGEQGLLTLEEKKLTQALMLERLKLPIRKKALKPKEANPIITNSNEPSYLALALNKNHEGSQSLLKFAPFAIEAEGVNTLDGDELVVFDTALLLNKHEVSIQAFDLIRIQRLNTKQMPFETQNPLSWNLKIGTAKELGISKRDYFTDFGTGLAWDIVEGVKFYSMLNLALHSEERKYRYRPNLGVYNNFGDLRFTLEMGFESDLETDKTEQLLHFNAQYRLQEKLSLFITYNKEAKENAQFGLKWFY